MFLSEEVIKWIYVHERSVENRSENQSRSRKTRRGCRINGTKKRWRWHVGGDRAEERSGWVGNGV